MGTTNTIVILLGQMCVFMPMHAYVCVLLACNRIHLQEREKSLPLNKEAVSTLYAPHVWPTDMLHDILHKLPQTTLRHGICLQTTAW